MNTQQKTNKLSQQVMHPDERKQTRRLMNEITRLRLYHPHIIKFHFFHESDFSLLLFMNVFCTLNPLNTYFKSHILISHRVVIQMSFWNAIRG